MCTEWEWLDWNELWQIAERGALIVRACEREDCASEFVAETIARGTERLKSLPPAERRAYLTTCAYRFAVRYEQRRRRQQVESLESRVEGSAVQSQDSSFAALLEAEWWRVIADEMVKLTPTQRDIIRLVYFEDYDIARAGRALGMKPGAARQRHFQGLKHLRQALDRRGLDLEGATPYLQALVQRVAADGAGAGMKISSNRLKTGHNVSASGRLYIDVGEQQAKCEPITPGS